MPRLKTFPDKTMGEIKLILPADKLDELRLIARKNGLAVTDYCRALIFQHVLKIANTGNEN